MEREVHLDVLHKEKLVNYDVITLVTQLTSSRYDKLCNLFKRWPGKSFVLLLSCPSHNVLPLPSTRLCTLCDDGEVFRGARLIK